MLTADALHRLPLDEVRVGGPQDPRDVHARMVVEAVDLGRDDGMDYVRRHLRQRDHRSVHRPVKRRDLVPVAIVEIRGPDRRVFVRQLDPGVCDVQHTDPQQEHDQRREHAEAVGGGREELPDGDPGGVEGLRRRARRLQGGVVVGGGPDLGAHERRGPGEAVGVEEDLVALVRVDPHDTDHGEVVAGRQFPARPVARRGLLRARGRGEHLQPGRDVVEQGQDEVAARPRPARERAARRRGEQHGERPAAGQVVLGPERQQRARRVLDALPISSRADRPRRARPHQQPGALHLGVRVGRHVEQDPRPVGPEHERFETAVMALRLLQEGLSRSAYRERFAEGLDRRYGPVIKELDFRSTTSDQRLLDAMYFIMTNEHNPKQYLEATLDLSFASKKWQRTVLVKRKGKSWFRRQHLETCVFSCLADELKKGYICCLGSERFADYRNQLLSCS